MRQVFESIVDAVSGSNWSYLIVFVIAMLDAFFPVVPSEATAIAAGVVAGTDGRDRHRREAARDRRRRVLGNREVTTLQFSAQGPQSEARRD